MNKFFISIYLLVALILAFYIYKSYIQKSKLGYLMSRLLTFALIIDLGYCLNLISNNYNLMSLGNSLIFVSINFMLLSMIRFISGLTGLKLNSLVMLIIHIYAVAEGIIFITNPIHNTAVNYEVIDFYESIVLNPIINFPFSLHLAFSYLLVAISIFLLVKKLLHVPKAYKSRYTIILYSLLIVVIINYLFLSKRIILPLDLSILSYGIISFVLYIYTFEYKPWFFIYKIQKLILMNFKDPFVLFDYNDVIVYCNNSFIEIFGLNETEKLSLTLKDFLYRNDIKIIDLSALQNIEYIIEKNEEKIYYECKYLLIKDEEDKKSGTLISLHNITELKTANDKLKEHASQDQLTGLYNKYIFDSNIDKWNDKNLLPISVSVLNINNLKAINDFFGTQNGDNVVKCLAEIIKNEICDNYFAARLYGEDFVIVMPNTNEEKSVIFIEKIRNNFNSVKIFGFDINVEFGISTKNSIDNSMIDLISIAREIMNNKKILNESSLKNSLLESLKQSLIDSDLETEAHVERTNELAISLGKKLKLSDNDLAKLSLLAILHDIGKIAIPNYILLKPDKLTDEEWEIMKQHTTRGYRIAKSHPELSEIAYLILSHHERWDGKGYPNRLKGEEIPLLSRIISIVDAYDVMTHDRPYHKAISDDEAINELRRCSGTQFNPEITEIFISMLLEE